MAFGCRDKAAYEYWVPHVCGICCVKMVGDTYGLTNQYSLYDLTMQCKSLGGFKESKDGKMRGVFHHPLVELAKEVGLAGRVERRLENDRIKAGIKKNHFAVLSIDLHRLTGFMNGDHLILIHQYDSEKDSFILHDCAALVGCKGKNTKISPARLDAISNYKGIVLWKPEAVNYPE